MVVQLYHFESSVPSRVVRMVAKHIGLELELRELDIFKGEHMKPEFLAINPAHTVPTLVEDDFVLSESGAIILYLIRQHAPDSPLYPRDVRARALVDKLLMYDIGTLYKAVSNYFYPILLHKQPPNAENEKKMTQELTLLQSFFVGRKYTAGNDLTLADFSILGTLTLFEVAEYSLEDYPPIEEYIARMKAELPYFEEVNRPGIDAFKAYAKR